MVGLAAAMKICSYARPICDGTWEIIKAWQQPWRHADVPGPGLVAAEPRNHPGPGNMCGDGDRLPPL